MKKSLLILALSIITIIGINAQEIGVGLKGGLNFPSADALSTQDGLDASGSSGYHAGLFGKFKFSKIGVQPEILYSFTKVEFQDVDFGSGVTGDFEQTSAYLTMPIMLRLYLLQGLNLQVGPQFGLLVSGETVSNVAGAESKEDIQDVLTSSDISLGIGAGFDLPFGLDIHVRYNLGLTDNADVAGATDESNNSQFQVSVGYSLFKLGR